MKKLLEFALLCLCIKLTYSQDFNTFVNGAYSISNIAMDLIVDTTPAAIPMDYYDFCECTEISTIANVYSFEDAYRKPFTNKTPAKYLLCSIVQFDSVSVWDNDPSLSVINAKAVAFETFFSPYHLNYWKPNEDVLESDEFITGFRTIYDSILRLIGLEESKKPETKRISIVIVPDEITIMKNAMNASPSNLFLLRINDSDKDDIIAYQFFSDGEFDISSLYSPLQYYKYLRDRCLNYYQLRMRENGVMGNN